MTRDAVCEVFGLILELPSQERLKEKNRKAFCMNCESDGKLYSVDRRCKHCGFLCCPLCMPKEICKLCQSLLRRRS